MDMLRNDIAATDGLVAQLQGLPACSPAAGSTAAAAAPAAPETSTATSPPTASAAAKPAPDTAQTVTLRFDDKVFGLTPLSIRAFNKTVDAIHDGAEVRLAIDGCDASADFSKDSPCAKRVASVKRLLAEKGITDPKRVLGDHP
jgi:hypothetical protein